MEQPVTPTWGSDPNELTESPACYTFSPAETSTLDAAGLRPNGTTSK